MEWTTEVVRALAERIAAAGLGTWRPTGVYAADETGIVIRAMPPSPTRVIVISAYTVTESAHLSDKVQGFQIRVRGTTDPSDADNLADQLRDELHGARDFDLGPARIAHLWRQSHTSMGRDGSGRWETSSNMYAVTAQASRHAVD